MTNTQTLTYIMNAGIAFCIGLFAFVIYIEKQFEGMDEITYDFSSLPDSSFAFRKQYSLECTRTDNIPEFGEAHHIKVNRQNDIIFCETETSVSTHSSLNIKLTETSAKSRDNCDASITYISIVQGKKTEFYLIEGYMQIDPIAYDNDTLKAKFDFTFGCDTCKDAVFWSGKIYKVIEK